MAQAPVKQPQTPENDLAEDAIDNEEILDDDDSLDVEPPVAMEGPADALDDDKLDVGLDEDEDLLEGIPEEELKATVEVQLPRVGGRASKAKARKRTADAGVTMLTGDPVRMYLKEIGKVPLLTAAEEIDLAMKIEAGVAATEELERAEDEGIELERREKRRLGRIEQVGLDAKQQLIEANLRLVVSIAKRYVGRGMLFSGPYPGRQPRPHPRGGEVRLHQGLQVLHVRHMVDSPGHHARHRRPGAHHPHPRAHGGDHQQARAHPAPASAGAGPRAHPGGDRRGDGPAPPSASARSRRSRRSR